MNSTSLHTSTVIVLAIALILPSGSADAAESQTQSPLMNVVLILVDNVGYGDFGCYGNPNVKTPNIDQLSREGVRCTSFYIGSPSCMPSRGALLTGRHPLRNGLNEQLWRNRSEEQIGLSHRERLLPQYLKERGYVTGCFGKWNLGFAAGSRPTERGFDEFLGHPSGNMHYYRHIYDGRNDLYRGTQSVTMDGYCTDLFADAACDFIRRHAGRPLLAYVPFNAAHYPNPRNHQPNEPVIWQAPKRYFEMYGWPEDEPDEQKRYWAVLTALDDGVGRILKQLDEQDLADRTLVILLSDNGAFLLPRRGLEVASNRPFRAGGVALWEGGTRVPFIARWPGRIKPGVSEALVCQVDLLASCAALAGAEPPTGAGPDSVNVLPALLGESQTGREQLVEHAGRLALRRGTWKLVPGGGNRPAQAKPAGKGPELHDLENDLGETANVASDHPDQVKKLGAELNRIRAAGASE